MNLLHIYGQGAWHDPAFVAGDRAALVAMLEAIERALAYGQSKHEAMVSDGEGYNVHVICLDGDWQSEAVQALPLPYTSDLVPEAPQGAWGRLYGLASRVQPIGEEGK